MSKTLYLMRHGQTLFNQRHLIQGWCDSPLTDLGIYQAQIAGNYFSEQGIHFDQAFSSTSERACDTLEIATNGQVSYQRIKGLKEWNFGVFEGESEDLNPALPYEDFFVHYGGESQQELQDRMNRTISELMEQSSGGHYSHGITWSFNCEFARAWKQHWRVDITSRMTNCCILKFTYSDHIFYLEDVIHHDFSGWTGDEN